MRKLESKERERKYEVFATSLIPGMADGPTLPGHLKGGKREEK